MGVLEAGIRPLEGIRTGVLRAAMDFHGIDLADNHWVTGRDSRTELAHSSDVATRVDYTVLRSLVAGARNNLSEVRLLTPRSYMALGSGRKYDDFAARDTELLAKLVGITLLMK